MHLFKIQPIERTLFLLTLFDCTQIINMCTMIAPTECSYAKKQHHRLLWNFLWPLKILNWICSKNVHFILFEFLKDSWFSFSPNTSQSVLYLSKMQFKSWIFITMFGHFSSALQIVYNYLVCFTAILIVKCIHEHFKCFC